MFARYPFAVPILGSLPLGALLSLRLWFPILSACIRSHKIDHGTTLHVRFILRRRRARSARANKKPMQSIGFFICKVPVCGARHLISVLKHLIPCRPLHSKNFCFIVRRTRKNSYSHSIVPMGLGVRSKSTRLMPSTSCVILSVMW